MTIRLIGSDAHYTVEQLCSMLLPDMEGSCVCEVRMQERRGTAICNIHTAGGHGYGIAHCTLGAAEKKNVNLQRRMLARAVYRAALALLPEAPEWGMLSGVRPGKLTRGHIESGGTQKGAAGYLRREFFVSPEKADLCAEIGAVAAAVQQGITKNDFSLYAHIPFCPSRCSYCSFISTSEDAFRRWGALYLHKITEELAMLGHIRETLALNAQSIYVGGGTPSIYSPQELEVFCNALTAACGGAPEEFTLEAGRPDAITREKLMVLQRAGVNRICVNPQTFQEKTLQRIGRNHSAADTLHAFRLAREAGFSAINCDLIAGLPGEGIAEFQDTLRRTIELDAENITVHTLAMKRGSNMNADNAGTVAPELLREMLALAARDLRSHGYMPYYLYRQKYTGGGFENIGWTKKGHICTYNVCMMEELGNILSAGAGAVTKLTSGEFRRFSNPKYPGEYLEAADMAARERELRDYFRIT